MPPQTHLCSKLQQPLTPSSLVLSQSPPCRTFQSDEDTPQSLNALLLVWTSHLCPELLQIMYHLFVSSGHTVLTTTWGLGYGGFRTLASACALCLQTIE